MTSDGPLAYPLKWLRFDDIQTSFQACADGLKLAGEKS